MLLTNPPAGLVDRVVVEPGNILFVNNRLALHGRDKVEPAPRPGDQAPKSRFAHRGWHAYQRSPPLGLEHDRPAEFRHVRDLPLEDARLSNARLASGRGGGSQSPLVERWRAPYRT